MIFLFEIILILLTIFYIFISIWLISGQKKLRNNRLLKSSAPKHPNVSIVIAARNEELNITECLTKCVNQDYPKEKFEVIIVNDRSEDDTAKIIEEFVNEYENVRLINVSELPETYLKSGKKHALKQGIENSTGEILLLTDADCLPEPGWIKGILKCFDDQVGAVVGHSPIKGRGFINRLIQLDNLSIFAVGAGGIGGGYPILSAGRNFAYRRKVYDEIGGFEQIKDFSSGDDDLVIMLVRENTNWKINFTSEQQSFVYTHPPQNVKTAIKQRMRWASKGLHYTFPMTLSLIAMFLYNFSLFIAMPLFFAGLINGVIPLISLSFKLVLDYLIIFQAAKLLNETKLLKYYPIAALFHIPYLIFFGLYGTFGKVQWKSG